MVSTELLKEWDMMPEEEPRAAWLVFQLSGYRCAMPAHLVQHIGSRPILFPLLNTPADVRGFMNYREEVIPVFDWALRYHWAAPGYDRFSAVVVYGAEQRWSGVWVERVDQLLTLTSGEGAEVTRDHPLAPLARRVVTVAGELLYLLDEELLLLS